MRVTIDILPGDVLLIIFYFDGPEDVIRPYYSPWHRLVHVCRVPEVAISRFCVAKLSRPETRLRSLGTRQACRYLATLANHHKEHGQLSMPDLHAAIAHRDRIREIDLNLSGISGPELQRLISVMQEPFPAPIYLRLAYGEVLIGDGFLGGSASNTPCTSEISLVRDRPCRPFPLGYFLFRIHFTRDARHSPVPR